MKLIILLSAITLSQALPAFPTLGGGQSRAAAGGCKAMTVVFARGTTESGTLGTVVGPPLMKALGTAVGGANNVDAQGVPYPADIPGFLAGGDANGSKMMAKMVGDALTNCPNSKVVMAGYSQGGQLVHNAAKMLTPAQSAAVSSAVIFGDPDNKQPVGSIPAAKTKVICHTGDNICAGGSTILAPHLTYGNDAGTAAAFIASAAGMAK